MFFKDDVPDPFFRDLNPVRPTTSPPKPPNRWAKVECTYCGYSIDVQKIENRPYFCCQACQTAHREDNR